MRALSSAPDARMLVSFLLLVAFTGISLSLASELEVALAAERMDLEGAGKLDLGAYSSRPGAADVPPEEELKRLETAVKAVRKAVAATGGSAMPQPRRLHRHSRSWSAWSREFPEAIRAAGTPAACRNVKEKHDHESIRL